MRDRKPDRFEPIAKALQWVIGVTVAVIAGFFVWSSSKNTSFQYNNFGLVLEQKGVLLDPFEEDSEGVVKELGMPYRQQSLRVDEVLMYWDFDPVRVQIHFHEDEVARIAFFTSSGDIRENLVKQIIAYTGGTGEWEEKANPQSGRVLISPSRQRTIEITDASVLLYGYARR